MTTDTTMETKTEKNDGIAASRSGSYGPIFGRITTPGSFGSGLVDNNDSAVDAYHYVSTSPTIYIPY